MKKKVMEVVFRTIWMGVAFALLAGCAVSKPLPPRATVQDAAHYLARPMTVSQVKRDWGLPLVVMDLGREICQWVYPLRSAPVSGYQYFLIRAGKVVVSGVWLTDVSG